MQLLKAFSFKKIHKVVTLLLLAMFFPIYESLSQNKSINDFFLFSDFIHTNNVHTVLFNKKGFELAAPIIRLNSHETLMLQFDDLDADYKDYHYTIIHCNADWTPSRINPFDYLEGFTSDRVSEYAFSFNTRVPYTHYAIEFPNNNMRPRLSGNYVIRVFLNGDPDQVVLTRRFLVIEPRAVVSGRVSMANLIHVRDAMQQVSFTVNISGLSVSNPLRDIRTVVTQNGRWDNAITNIQPRSVQGNQLVYDHEETLLFEAGNEFRRFDIRSLRYSGERVASLQAGTSHWDVFLQDDPVRASRRYTSDNDINGRFTIKNNDGRNDNLESDYAWVHFSLPMSAPLYGASVYVMGELSLWQFTERNRMIYNHRQNKYQLSLLLKQGYYNYAYASIRDRQHQATAEDIEGSHSQTENDYTILIYYRQPGTLYDQLIGLAQLNSSL